MRVLWLLTLRFRYEEGMFEEVGEVALAPAGGKKVPSYLQVQRPPPALHFFNNYTAFSLTIAPRSVTNASLQDDGELESIGERKAAAQ